ncbi:MAG TPA: ThuA domain-containing protein [Verrucomicrobiota bacterium]|nr:ThuA domain-containing protein [Verrucomicrobiota bacterium]
MKFRSLLSVLAVVSLLTAEAAPKKVILVTATKGFRHSSIPTAENVITTLGQTSGAFTVVDVVRGGPQGTNDADVAEKLTLAKLNAVDGVIFANTTGDLALPDKEGFLNWLEAGHAFIGMHSASDTFHGFPPFIEMLGGEFLTHDAQVGISAVNQDPAHPATKSLGPTYDIFDEIYIFKSFNRGKVHGLLGLDAHPNWKFPGDFAVSWSKEVGRGRIFYTSLGHREDVWTSPSYQRHILGGIEWALGLAQGSATPQDPTARLSAAEAADGFKLLFDGKTLNGWKLRNPDGTKSWLVENGMLINRLEHQKDKVVGHGTDLVSDAKFRDFVVRYEYLIPPGANSGFYLRGRHEIQIFDDYDKKPELGGNGAIYSVSPVALMASRKPGQWQTVEAKIVGNMITVILNGVTVQQDVECNKGTGSHLDDNVDQPGPFLLQGDHGEVAFRNIRVKELK